MKGFKTYVYAIFENNEPIYVGKSYAPRRRYIDGHIKCGMAGDYCKILDFYYDKESFWILKLLNDGYALKNKKTHPIIEKWNIGDIIIK